MIFVVNIIYIYAFARKDFAQYFVNSKQTDPSVSPPPFHPSLFLRFLSGSVSVVRGRVSHGPQGGRAGDASRFRHGAPHTAAPTSATHTFLPTIPHVLLSSATAPANSGKT